MALETILLGGGVAGAILGLHKWWRKKPPSGPFRATNRLEAMLEQRDRIEPADLRAELLNSTLLAMRSRGPGGGPVAVALDPAILPAQPANPKGNEIVAGQPLILCFSSMPALESACGANFALKTLLRGVTEFPAAEILAASQREKCDILLNPALEHGWRIGREHADDPR